MPFYDYECEACGLKKEIEQLITDDKLTKCPKCKKETFERLITGNVGIIFKGSGFYCTDYKGNVTEGRRD